MTESPRSRFRLSHWGWFLLATIILVVGFVGLSVWLPWHREQQVIQQIEGWGGRVETETGGPEWVRKVLGNDQLTESEVFERVFGVIAHGTTITDADIAHLSRLPNLRRIYLSYTAVTDSGLAHLARHKNLSTLFLDVTAVTDSGLAHLSGLANLKDLYLNGTVVTDAGLSHLGNLTNLEFLSLRDSAVTDKGIEELQKALPHCKIRN